MEAIYTGQILFNFETTECKNHLTQIWSKSNQQLLRYCHFHVLLYFSNGIWWPFWNAKMQTKIELALNKKHSGTKLDQFQPRVLDILSFSYLCYFSNGP